MEHDHCCHDHGCGDCQGCAPADLALTRPQAAFLARFAQTPYLPLARFLLRASREDELESVGLPAVFLEDGGDLDVVKKTGALLEELAGLGLISLDYDIPLSNFDYAAYDSSPLYAQFRETVAQGAGRPGFLFDTPVLEKGSMALTDLGRATLDQVLELL